MLYKEHYVNRKAKQSVKISRSQKQ